MQSNDINAWLEKEAKRHSGSNRKILPANVRHGYVHFDSRISLAVAAKKATDPNYIKFHKFLPFIRKIDKVRRLSRGERGVKSIPSKAEKPRPIDRPSHFDGFIYSWYAFQLGIIYEEILVKEGLSDSIIGYRSIEKKNNVHFAKEIFDQIKDLGPCTAICLDVDKFFENLNHSILKEAWQKLVKEAILPPDHYRVFRSLTAFSFVIEDDLYKMLRIRNYRTADGLKRLCADANEFYRFIKGTKGLIQYNQQFEKRDEKKVKEKGIPQGSQLSGLLSNIYMFPFDRNLISEMRKIGGIYRRYSDDIIIIIPRGTPKDVMGKAKEELERLRLTISAKKTDIVDFEKEDGVLRGYKIDSHGTKKRHSLQYLGLHFDGSNIFLRPQTLSRESRKMKWSVKRQKTIARKNSAPLRLSRLYAKRSHLGGKNFYRYLNDAQKITKSEGITRQKKKLFRNLKKEIAK